MESGYYNGVAGLYAAARAHEVIANNLANLDTAGFKASRPFVEALSQQLVDSRGDQPQLAGQGLDLSPGAVRPTGRPLDFVLEDGTLLAVSTPRGERYTRDGRLTLDADGTLVTMGGLRILGDTGSINVGQGPAEVAEDGSILVEGIEVGRLRFVQIGDPTALVPEGRGLYASAQPLAVNDEAHVRPGYVEASNVDPVRGTITLIEALRRFEAIEKAQQLLMGDMTKSLFEVSARSLR